MTRPVRVLIVDDSATVRLTLTEILSSDPQISVMGSAADPVLAAEILKREVPDVITLDIEMPRMNGLTFLDRLMAQHPIPVVICSAHTPEGSKTALLALEKGALEIIAKPKLGTADALRDAAIRICDAVKAAAQARPKKRNAQSSPTSVKLTADAMLPPPELHKPQAATEMVIAVGASTGGPQALTTFLRDLPANSPGVVIVQHMPEKFTSSFAARLNGLCDVEVREARDGDQVVPGLALIAPGNLHMLLKRVGSRYHVEVKSGPLVCRHRPSVDVLFRSVARYAGKNSVGVILTGMGDDGAQGMLEMKSAGAFTIAQDEATCAVFGMPQQALKLGGAQLALPLPRIAAEVLRRRT